MILVKSAIDACGSKLMPGKKKLVLVFIVMVSIDRFEGYLMRSSSISRTNHDMQHMTCAKCVILTFYSNLSHHGGSQLEFEEEITEAT